MATVKRLPYVKNRKRVTKHTDPLQRKTKSEFKDMTAIGNILKKYNVEQLMQLNQNMGYVDTTLFDENNMEKYVDQHQTLKARFNNMPAHLRSKFRNDEFEFLHWIKNPQNEEEARRLQILPEKKKEETVNETVITKVEKATT